MSTRGIYGFRVNGQDKLAFNHFDSYPEGLGLEIKAFLEDAEVEDIKAMAEKIVLVEGSQAPTSDHIEECKAICLSMPSSETEHECNWYDLLDKARGKLSFFKRGLRYMIDEHDFLTDVGCEWVYIMNVDTRILEVHRGCNDDPKAPGRYASLVGERIGDFQAHGPALKLEITFEQVCRISDEAFVDAITDVLDD